MKTIKIFLSILILLMAVLSGCAKQETPAATDPYMAAINNVKAENIADSENIQLDFNVNLLKKLTSEQSNTFYSSFSINQALTMVYFATAGETQQEIKDTLGYGELSDAEIAAYQKYLLDVYNDSGDTTFTSANSMWIDDEIDVYKSYIDTMTDNFDSEVANIDLQSNKAVTTINKWIDKRTEGMIPILFEEPFDPLARLVLINAIYFNGNWSIPFNPESTREREFNGTDGTQKADFMYSGKDVLGYADDDYMAVKLPYGDDERFCFVAVMPSDIDAFIADLDAQKLSQALNTFEMKSDTTLLLPKFEMEKKVLLNDTLEQLGMQKAFYKGANFSNVADMELHVSRVLHKAKITVDELGTEAAAVTAVEVVAECMPMDPFEFICDKPFLFFIMDDETDTVIFTGAMYNIN